MPSNKIIGRISSDPNIYGKVGEINGVKDHNRLANRSLPDQHPIEAITGLREELDKRDPATNQKIKVWDATAEDYINFGANDEIILIAGNNISFDVITEEQENNEEELQIPSITINSTLDPKNQRVKTGNVIFNADAIVDIIADTTENNPIEVAGDNVHDIISIKHKEVVAAEPTAKKVGYDKYGHTVLGADLKTSDLTNDGDGSDNHSPFATQKWVDTNGGKIDSISINGTAQQIVNKNVDLPAYPTKASLGLDNVDNTSDANKPISTAQQAALDLKADKATTYTKTEVYNKTEADALLGAKQNTISQANMLSSDLVDDTNKTHKFASAAQLAQIATNTNDIGTVNDRVSVINTKIPSAASSSNQLADKDFVNSSIGTATANFIGTFPNITELKSYTGIVTNNDYAFVQNQVLSTNFNNFNALDAVDKTTLSNYDYGWVINAVHNTRFDLYRFDIISQTWVKKAEDVAKSEVTLNTAYNRYKAAVDNNVITWSYEYTLNNSSFTVEQWNAINSGINTLLVADIQSNYAAIHGVNGLDSRVGTLEGQVPDIIEDISDLENGKQDTINDLSDIRSGAGLGATAVQPEDLATVATTGDYDDLDNKPDLSAYATNSDLQAGLETKQDTLVGSGANQNIKTVNDISILGSGNVNIASPFPSSWRTDSIAHLIADVEADSSAVVGKSYLGEVDVTASEGLFNGNAEFMINIMDVQSGDKVIWCIASSATNAPYHWETTFVGGQISPNGAISFQPIITPANKLSAELISGLANVATSGDYDDLLNKPEATKEYLETTTITGVSGSTTASKATAGTDINYGTADVDTAVTVMTGFSNSGVAYAAEYNSNKCSLKLTRLTPSTDSITPAKAADVSQTITPYTFADVTVPVADQNATTVATGSQASQGAATHGIQVVTDVTNNNNNN